MSRKGNANKRPATLEECEREHTRGVSDGNREGLAIYLTVMRDKFGYGAKRLKRLWDGVESLCDLISAEMADVGKLREQLQKAARQELCPMMGRQEMLFQPPPQPITVASAGRCYRRGREAGWQFATLCFLMALRRKEGYGSQRIHEVYHAADQLRESLRGKYVAVDDLETILLEEQGVKIG